MTMDNVPAIIEAVGIAAGALLLGGSSATVVVLKVLLPHFRKFKADSERSERRVHASKEEVTTLAKAVDELKNEVHDLRSVVSQLCNEISAMTGKPINPRN